MNGTPNGFHVMTTYLLCMHAAIYNCGKILPIKENDLKKMFYKKCNVHIALVFFSLYYTALSLFHPLEAIV